MQDVLVSAKDEEFILEINPEDRLARKLKIFVGDKELTNCVVKAVFVMVNDCVE